MHSEQKSTGLINATSLSTYEKYFYIVLTGREQENVRKIFQYEGENMLCNQQVLPDILGITVLEYIYSSHILIFQTWGTMFGPCKLIWMFPIMQMKHTSNKHIRISPSPCISTLVPSIHFQLCQPVLNSQ